MTQANVRKITKISILVALAGILHAVEAVIPVPYVIPGAKLGLANVVALFAVVTQGLGQSLLISFLRTLIGSLISGTFLNVGYYLSVSGAIVSTLAMYAANRLSRGRLSVVGISVAGAFAHNTAQLVTASLILRQAGVFFYLPYLLFFAIPTGIFVGFLAGRIISFAEKFPKLGR
ncbi:MAG: Gx transporter family protein [Candidatus Fermentithermobacillus carboniphilus]|uniref:Gx transporter family protein n=1 Tax=Candidatus Fermentithermobacillus carboniphilus TaxID=3085328 RepID=A0AAT9LAN8_9FIRM|nr:MAG: Gx transporter family protein [Candidatus Fermentithermobacillus carboniphilus]